MDNVMVGYDMILSIGQDEINSQFERLARAGFIVSKVASNGVIVGGILGGNTPKLISYLRGWVHPPQVTFGKRNDTQEVEFAFSFIAHDVQPNDPEGWTSAELEAAFAAQSATATDAVLERREDIPVRDPVSTLSKQRIRYWLRRHTVTLGTTKVQRYAIVPAISYTSSASERPILLSLEGLELRFAVQLNQIPVTAKDFEAGVAQGRVPPEVLKAVTDHAFNEDVFGLQQLFLDFDTVDFTQWDLRDPADALGSTVSLVVFGDGGSYTVDTGVSLKVLMQQDPQFSVELSTNLQDVFGFQDKNPGGRTPYILGVAVAQPKGQVATVVSGTGAALENNAQASLVPMWIGYSSTPNPTNDGWSTINYEVLGGRDPNFEKRIPRNADKSVRHLTTPLISSNDFSGVLLFARSVFFDPLLFGPVQSALATGAPWTQDGMTFTSVFDDAKKLDHEDDTWGVWKAKIGYKADITQTDHHTYTIRVAGNRVTVSIDLHRHVELTAKLYLGIDDDLKFSWTRDFRGSSEAVLETYVDQNEHLHFKVTPPPDLRITCSEKKDSLAHVADKIIDGLEKFAMRSFNPASETLNELAAAAVTNFRSHADALKQLVLRSSHTHFISPTGQIFFLNNPHYDDDLNLQMDVTYDV
ncbi:hypothetical protein [Pendulispora albinea]|uniref:Uncharacterized protein n=1 Tax=Pendulispora albinea TaxID=2741071 RepID=A0ABZ2M7S2_9BACT